MFISLPARDHIPRTEIYLKIKKKDNTQNTSWSRDVIILIPGGPGGNHTLYADIEEGLLELADLVLIDLRGCGLSSKSEAQYCTLDNHIDDLYFILGQLKIPFPIIHGCSYGAIVTLGFSIKYQEIPKKIILASCAISGSFLESAQKNLSKLGTAEQIKAAEKLWSGKFENPDQFAAYYQSMAPLYFFKKNTAKSLPTSALNIPYNVELVNLAFTTFLKTFDYQSSLSKIKDQALIFAGKKDWIFDHTQAEILHYGIAHSILISLEDCGHFPWKDQPEKFLSAIKNFIVDYPNLLHHQESEAPSSFCPRL